MTAIEERYVFILPLAAFAGGAGAGRSESGVLGWSTQFANDELHLRNLTMRNIWGFGGASFRPGTGTPSGGAGGVAARPAGGRGRGRAPMCLHARPRLEDLEGRLVLSTNATAALAGGNLTITVP